MNSTVCPIGRKDSCEDYPEVTQEGLCGLLFETARPWQPIVDRMDGLSAASCPLSPGEYAVKGAEMQVIQDEVDSQKLKSYEGEWAITLKYFLNGIEAGCQYIEAVLEEEKKKREKKRPR